MSLTDYLKALFSTDSILDFQLNRKKTRFNFVDRYFLSENRKYHNLFFGNKKVHMEYLHRGESLEQKHISEYPKLEGAVEIATAPHLLGLKEIDALAVFLNKLPQDKYIYALSKIENFSGLYGLARPLSIYLGIFPINREFPTRKQLEVFYRLVADSNKAVSVAVTGTRMSSGFGEVNIGLERAIRRGINDEITHNIIPVSLSYDIRQNEYYITASDLIEVKKEDFEGKYSEKGALTAKLENVLKSSMKITFNHLAAVYITDKFSQEKFFDESAMYNDIETLVPKLEQRGINIDNDTIKKAGIKKSIDDFLVYAYNYMDGRGKNNSSFGVSFLEYEEKIRENLARKRIFGLKKGKNYDEFTLSEKNQATEKFGLISPIEYMADMVAHINLHS